MDRIDIGFGADGNADLDDEFADLMSGAPKEAVADKPPPTPRGAKHGVDAALVAPASCKADTTSAARVEASPAEKQVVKIADADGDEDSQSTVGNSRAEQTPVSRGTNGGWSSGARLPTEEDEEEGEGGAAPGADVGARSADAGARSADAGAGGPSGAAAQRQADDTEANVVALQSDSESDDSGSSEGAARSRRNSQDLDLLNAFGGQRVGSNSPRGSAGDAATAPKASAGAGGAEDVVELQLASEDEGSDGEGLPSPRERRSRASDRSTSRGRSPEEVPARLGRERSRSPPAPAQAQRSAQAPQAPAQASAAVATGPADLLAMMDSAVACVEADEGQSESDGAQDASPKPAARSVVAPLTSVSTAKAAAKSAASSATKAKPASRIVGREDVIDRVVRDGGAQGSDRDTDGPAASPLSGVGVGGLAQMRKAYNGGAPTWTRSGEEHSEGESEPERETPNPPGNRRPSVGSADAPGGDLADEWAEIEARTNEIREKEAEDRGRIRANDDIVTTPISFQEVNQWLLQMPVDQDVIQQFKDDMMERKTFCCMMSRGSVSDIPGLDRKLARDKDLVLFLKSVDFDFNEPTHFRMLRTAYTKLTRNKVCPMIGKHWEVLGFQHTDPRTDINRSGRLLNVLHFFFFFSHHFDILKSAYLLAQDTEQNFPLGCVCINLTKMVVETLIDGRLSRLCNSSEKGVFDTTCRVFSGALFHFYYRWKSQKRTIRDTELTFKEVRALLEKSPKKLIDGLKRGIEEQKAKTDPGRFEFTDLDFTGRRPQGGGGGGGGQPSAAQAAVPRRLRNYQDAS